jgi:hypothetical protein
MRREWSQNPSVRRGSDWGVVERVNDSENAKNV